MLVSIAQPAAKSHTALDKLIIVAHKSLHTPLGLCMYEVEWNTDEKDHSSWTKNK